MTRTVVFGRKFSMKKTKDSSSKDGTAAPPARVYSKARPLAARIGVSSKTLFRWAAAGRISTFRVNRRVVLFDEGQVLAFVQSCGTTPLGKEPATAVA